MSADPSPSPPPAGVAASARPSLSALNAGRAAAMPIRRKRRNWLGLVVVAIVLAVAAAVAFIPRPVEVQASAVMTAYPSAQYAQLTASGYVVAQRRAAVSSKATGRLLELNVREGSVVKTGELIARVEAADVLAAVQAAQAGIAQADAGLLQAQAGVRQAEVELGNAEAELQRATGLRAQEFVSAQAVDAAQRRADAARAGLAASRAGIAAAQATQAQARAQLKVQRVNQDNTEIRAPFDGVVLLKNANVGDLITPFSNASGTSGAVVTMADMTTLEVEADVSESNIGRIKIGQPVEIALDALPDARFRGTVGRIVPTVDRAKATVMTKIRFDRLDPRILPEMSAKVVFLSQSPTAAEDQPVMAVNPKTLMDWNDGKVVYRIVDATVEAVPVKPGRTLGDAVEITSSSLKPGDRLVLDPGKGVVPGAKVSVAGK